MIGNNEISQKLSNMKPIDLFRLGINNIYPLDLSPLLRLCIRQKDFPLGFSHPDILAEVANYKLVSSSIYEDIRTAYICLSSYYFLLDAVVDGHLEDREDALYLSHLLTGAIILFEKSCRILAPDKIHDLEKSIFHAISENSSAVKAETKFQVNPLEISEKEEYDSIVNRSNSFLLLYELLCILGSQPTDSNIQNMLRDFVYFLQFGDDLGDWRHDYRLKRWTPVLRICFQRNGRVLSEDETETYIYLSGYYEETAANIINGLDSLLTKFEKYDNAKKMQALITSQRNQIFGALKDFVATKLSIAS